MPSITARTFQLAAPYWLRAPDRRAGWALAAVLVASVLLLTALNLGMTELQKAFFDALQAARRGWPSGPASGCSSPPWPRWSSRWCCAPTCSRRWRCAGACT
jgi:hypothetical protein